MNKCAQIFSEILYMCSCFPEFAWKNLHKYPVGFRIYICAANFPAYLWTNVHKYPEGFCIYMCAAVFLHMHEQMCPNIPCRSHNCIAATGVISVLCFFVAGHQWRTLMKKTVQNHPQTKKRRQQLVLRRKKGEPPQPLQGSWVHVPHSITKVSGLAIPEFMSLTWTHWSPPQPFMSLTRLLRSLAWLFQSSCLSHEHPGLLLNHSCPSHSYLGLWLGYSRVHVSHMNSLVSTSPIPKFMSLKWILRSLVWLFQSSCLSCKYLGLWPDYSRFYVSHINTEVSKIQTQKKGWKEC